MSKLRLSHGLHYWSFDGRDKRFRPTRNAPESLICAFEFLLCIVLICWTHGEQLRNKKFTHSADVAQLARAPPCQGGGRGFESRHPLATPSGWGGRVVRQRPAKPRTRVRIPSPPRSDFRGSSKAGTVGICKT